LSFSGAKTALEGRKFGLMKVFPPPRPPAVYHPGVRFLHWLMAALIFVALPLGVWASLTPRGETRSGILFFHKSFGMTLLCLVALRIVWRLIVGAPAYAEPLGRFTHAAARSAHIALYALMIAMPVSGYLSSNGAGAVVPWFDLFSFPHLVPKNDALRVAAGQAHYVFAWTIAFVLAAHLGAVVWHTAIKRDSVLTRMWPRYRPASTSAKSRPHPAFRTPLRHGPP
jgi:cytochrome b561